MPGVFSKQMLEIYIIFSNYVLPTRQFTTGESVKQEHIQMLGYGSLLIRTLEMCATNMEELLQACTGSV